MILWSNFKQYLAVTFSVHSLIAPLNNHWRFFCSIVLTTHTHTHTHKQHTTNTHTQHTHTHTLSLSSLSLSLSHTLTHTHTHTILNQINSWPQGCVTGNRIAQECVSVCAQIQETRGLWKCVAWSRSLLKKRLCKKKKESVSWKIAVLWRILIRSRSPRKSEISERSRFLCLSFFSLKWHL